MRKRCSFILTITLFLIPFAGHLPMSTNNVLSQDEIKVIVDMDGAPDDLASILYLLKHPAVSVIGIGVSCGVAYVDTGVTNTLGILEHLGIYDIPVAVGKETPLVVDHAFPTPWRDGCYNIFGLDLPTTSLQPSLMNASELIISLVQSTEANITLIALGPLTNVAIALNSEPSIKSKIDKILLMGGAIDVPGNVGLESDIPNYVSEWNIWVDPHSADIVLKSGLPIQMVTLDATNQVPRTQAFLDRLESVMNTREARLLFNMTQPGLYFWDQLTVVSLTNPEVITMEPHCIEIVVDLENYEGQTNSTGTGCNDVQVGISADALLFEDLFIGYINDEFSSPTPQLLLFVFGGGIVVLVLVVFAIRKRK